MNLISNDTSCQHPKVKKKPVLVTGSARGIGKAIAVKYAQEGYPVIINGKSSLENLSALAVTITDKYHIECTPFLGDVSDFTTVKELFHMIEDRYEGLEILINNAGISHIGLLSDMDVSEWDRIIQTNLSSCFYCSKLAIPYMVARKQGKILNISSVWGITGASCEAAYSASKGGVNALTRALGKELAPSNIQVNAIACGIIDTEMNKFLDSDERRFLMEEVPAGRFGTAQEVAQLAFQITSADSYLTGQVIPFDGGWV